MGETRKITIEILNTNEESDAEKRIAELEERFNKMLEPKTKNKNKKEKISAKQYFTHKALDQAFSLIKQTTSMSVNRYFNLNEDYMSENSYRNISTAVNKGVSLATTVVGGAMAGAKVGGVWGGIGGAIISTIGWGGAEFIQNQATLSSYYQSINASNMQTNFSRTRAGLADNGRGTEN